MTCCTCGVLNPTIHLTNCIDGISSQSHYCENCAPDYVRKHMREMKSGTFDPEAQWKAKWEKLHAEHPEYSSEAYDFVQKSMFHDHLKRNVQLQEGSRNISALIESCHAYAKELYGESARARLKSWGIDSFLDVGEIIILIGSGGARGMLNPDLERRLEEIHEKMRANLRRKYGQLPFLPEEAT